MCFFPFLQAGSLIQFLQDLAIEEVTPRRSAPARVGDVTACAVQVIDLRFDKDIVPHGIAGFEVLQLPVFQRWPGPARPALGPCAARAARESRAASERRRPGGRGTKGSSAARRLPQSDGLGRFDRQLAWGGTCGA